MSLKPTLPIEPIGSLVTLLDHLTSTPVHATYAPYLRFPVLHAVRVSIAWAAMTSSGGRDLRRVGLLQDLFGYLVMACMSVSLLSPPPLPRLNLSLLRGEDEEAKVPTINNS